MAYMTGPIIRIRVGHYPKTGKRKYIGKSIHGGATLSHRPTSGQCESTYKKLPCFCGLGVFRFVRKAKFCIRLCLAVRNEYRVPLKSIRATCRISDRAMGFSLEEVDPLAVAVTDHRLSDGVS